MASYSIGQQIAIAAFSFGLGLLALAAVFQLRSPREVIRLGHAEQAAARARLNARTFAPAAGFVFGVTTSLCQRISVLAATAACCTIASPASAVGATTPGGADFDPGTQRETHLLSQTVDGSWPDGPSQDPAFSQDRQYASVAAFDSDADNLVVGDVNRTTDVFAVYREQPYTLAGEPWRIHSAEPVSRGMGGAPADGPSYRPDVDGDQRHAPQCIAFVSAADNLVPGDSNGVPDAFVYDLYTHQIQRVSVASDGNQADGPTTEVKVDGGCTRVAFVSSASNLALTATTNPAAAKLVTGAPAPGTSQVYVRVLGDRGNNAGLQGLTFLASATSHGVPGNGDSAEPAFARSPDGCGGPKACADSGAEAVYFTSSSQNLSPNDADPGADIYKRAFVRDDGLDPVAVRTRLITLAADGESHHPSTNDTGRYVAFTTAADNLVPGDTNASLDVVRADTATTPFSFLRVSQSRAVGDPGNGDSDHPSISRPGSPVFFDSDASNLQPSVPSRASTYTDQNHSRDMFFWNNSHKVWLVGRDSSNHIINQPSLYGRRAERRRAPNEIAGPSEHPAGSYYGNYVLFESTYPLTDLAIAGPVLPAADQRPVIAARLSRTDPRYRQVYMRYVGPR